MKHTGKYCRIEDGFDLEQEINLAVDGIKAYIEKLRELDCSDYQLRQILKAVATTIVDEI